MHLVGNYPYIMPEVYENDVENINAETPLAKKLLGRIKGDTFGIELNNGLIAFYKVVDIK